MIIIYRRKQETVEQLIQRFKKACQSGNLFRDFEKIYFRDLPKRAKAKH